MEITKDIVEKVIETVDAGLVRGIGNPTPGAMCVEAAVCYALGLPHSDDPECVSRAIRNAKIILNDARWSNDSARAKGLRRLAVLQLGTRENFDDIEFSKKLALMVINKILPITLRKIGLDVVAFRCEQSLDLNTAAEAASIAADAAYDTAQDRPIRLKQLAATSRAADAARAAARAAAYAAAYAGRLAAVYAADAAARAYDAPDDIILNLFAAEFENILIEMKVPGVQWLDLL